MINKNYYCILDFETMGKDPYTCDAIQLGAVIVDPRKLEIVEDSEFSCWIKPEKFAEDPVAYAKEHQDNMQFHCNNFDESEEAFAQRLENALDEKSAWKSFVEYTKSWYVPGKSKSVKYNAPILVGYNIYNFDSIILNRLARKYKNVNKNGEQNVFHPQFSIDLLNTVFMWNENLTMLNNYKLDTIRKVVGINAEGYAHEAVKDCKDEATLLIKFLNLSRVTTGRIKGWH